MDGDILIIWDENAGVCCSIMYIIFLHIPLKSRFLSTLKHYRTYSQSNIFMKYIKQDM